MANYIPFVKPNYISKDGTIPIYVRYNYDRMKRTLIATGFSVKPEHWDDKKKWVKRACPNFEEINAVLTKITSKLGNILTYAKENDIDPDIEFVLLELERDRDFEQRSSRVDMFETLERYIIEKGPVVSVDQVKDYKTLRKHLTNFKQ